MTQIITPEERRAEDRGAHILLLGRFGAGKTWQARTLDPSSTLIVDIENGTLSIDDIAMAHTRPQSFPELQNLIVQIVGPNRSFAPSELYSQAHFDRCGGFLQGIEQYRTLFIDTVTTASRLSFRHASTLPEAVSERTGRPDQRAAYGAHARQFLLALHHLQSARGLNIILIGALETVTDDYGRIEHRLQAEGQRVPREIAGIVDEVITLDTIDFGDGKPIRCFVCTSNAWGFPAKDRSGRLEQIEPPDLGKLIAKILPPRASHGAAAAAQPSQSAITQFTQQAQTEE